MERRKYLGSEYAEREEGAMPMQNILNPFALAF
jgi:hypothetical protein